MMRTYAGILFGIFMVFCVHAHAQSDSTHKKKPLTARQKLIPNRVKLELVYKSALVTETSSNGFTRTYNVYQPFVRVNDAKPVEIGRHADFLRSFFSRCSEADEQIDLMNQQMRRAKLDFWGGFGLGSTIAFTGLGITASAKTPSATTFFTFFGVGAATMATGAIFAHAHAKKADEHLRLAVDIYNSRCYKPLPADTTKPAAAKTPAENAAVTASPMKLYRDTTLFRMIRNDPSHSGLFGITLLPVIPNISSLNISESVGVGAFYTYDSKFGVSVSYQRALIDDVKGNSRDDKPGGDAESYGIPANYNKSSLLDIQTKLTAISWEKEGTYHLHLGNTKIAGMHAEVVGSTKGTILRAITARLGYQMDNRLVESGSNGISYNNATPVYTYNWQGQAYPLIPTNLATSSTMVKAGVITAGIGYCAFSDMKIELLDDTYTGRREVKSQTDLFFDVMYAQSMTVQDMIYYYALEPVTGEYTHLPQRLSLSGTPVNKIGARVGFQTLSMYSPHFGWKSMLELGVRPGPQTVDKQEGFYLQMTIGIVFGGRISQQ